FTPLGMSDTGGDHNDLVLPGRAAGYSRRSDRTVNAPYIDMSIPVGGGSLYSTVGDLFLWDRALYAEKLVSKKSLEAIFTPYATAEWGDKVGYGWFLGTDKSGRKFTAHLGGINGFAASVSRYPDEKGLVVVLSNFSFAPVSDITTALAEIAFGNRGGKGN